MVSPGNAMACECGYLYILAGKAARDQLARVAKINIFAGAFLAITGILFTTLSYLFSDATYGFYVIYWGAIVFGGIRFFRGLEQRREAMRTTNESFDRSIGLP
jgi:hypothetical protein